MRSKEEILGEYLDLKTLGNGTTRKIFNKAMDEYADEQCIEFANWIAENISGSYFINNEGRFELPNDKGLIGVKELLEKFKQQSLIK